MTGKYVYISKTDKYVYISKTGKYVYILLIVVLV